MPTYEDEAIVLRHYPIADSDSIVVFITPEFGKTRTVAQGIKKPKSRLAGSLEPLNHIRITFFAREGRELGRIQHAELIHSYSLKITSLNHIFAFSYFSELIHTLVQDNQSNPTLFRLLLASLKAGEKLVPVQPLIRYFEVWCLKLSGLMPNYTYCSNCSKCVKDVGFFARIKDGHALCRDCAGKKGVDVGPAASRALQSMMRHAPEDFTALSLEEDANRQLERLTQELLEHNLDSSLKSYSVLRDALTDNKE